MNEPQMEQGEPKPMAGKQRTQFRIVIGAYGAAFEAESAADELRKAGLDERQTCLITANERATAEDFTLAPASASAQRQMAGSIVNVSSPRLFDQIWPRDRGETGAIASWMTESQSRLMMDQLQRGAVLLVVSANSPQEQIRASRIHLQHHPAIMQAYNFTE